MKEIDISCSSVGEIVANDFRSAAVFKDAGIDFCCGGKKSIEESCSESGINSLDLIAKLELLAFSSPLPAQNYREWEPGFLCDYIVNTHHKYVLKSLPELVHYTQKISSVHGERHPELIEIAELFSQINRELLQHLKNEEDVLFPAIKEVLKSGNENAKAMIISEISRLSAEHEFAGGAMDKIKVISNNYQLPSDSCNSYKVTFKLLEEFEDDLHIHVHLENNILFPKALKSISNK
jgi:regulator of cell morphogenesis and NO signaling